MVLFDSKENLVKLEEQIPLVYFIGEKHRFLWGKRDLGDHSIQPLYICSWRNSSRINSTKIFYMHSLICVGGRGRSN